MRARAPDATRREDQRRPSGAEGEPASSNDARGSGQGHCPAAGRAAVDSDGAVRQRVAHYGGGEATDKRRGPAIARELTGLRSTAISRLYWLLAGSRVKYPQRGTLPRRSTFNVQCSRSNVQHSRFDVRHSPPSTFDPGPSICDFFARKVSSFLLAAFASWSPHGGPM